MIDYNEIHRAYVESDAYLGRKEADARTPGSKGSYDQKLWTVTWQ